MPTAEHKSGFELKKGTPYLTLVVSFGVYVVRIL